MKKKILFLTTLLPYPLDNGGKIKSYNNLIALTKKYNVDLISFVNSITDIEYTNHFKGIVNSMKVVEKQLVRSESRSSFFVDYFKSIFSKYPYNIRKFYNKEIERYIKEALNHTEYDYIYIDHLPMMIYAKLFDKNKIILDQHNVESLIVKRMVDKTENTLKKLLLNIEYIKLFKFEQSAIKTPNKIIALSDVDRDSFVKMGANPSKIISLPIHIGASNLSYLQNKDNEKINLLFLGSMSWFPNNQGILWFLENVWPLLDKNIFHLFIVGSKPSQEVLEFGEEPSVTVTGYVDDIDDYVKACHVSIVPLFVGSGQRVKIIESFSKNIPVISTSIGAEGLIYEDEENILIANTTDEFRDSIIALSIDENKRKNITKAAYKNFYENYSVDLLPEKLNNIIN